MFTRRRRRWLVPCAGGGALVAALSARRAAARRAVPPSAFGSLALPRAQQLRWVALPRPTAQASGGSRQCVVGALGSVLLPGLAGELAGGAAARGARARSRPRRAAAEGHIAVEGGSEEDAGPPLLDNLADVAADLLERLREKQPQRHDGVTDQELPPLLPKRLWSHVGDLVKRNEEGADRFLPQDKWVTLRLDGCSWGTLMDRLKRSGVLRQGFSDDVASAMMATCRAVMCEFGAVLGFTHSDELTIFVPPSAEPRILGGALQSWVSIAASVASGVFNRKIAEMAAKARAPLEDVIVAHFDCRTGVFESPLEATALVLWRANDCNVNAASDAIKFSSAPMRVRAFNTIQKLQFLQERGYLPLRRHQAYGSLFALELGPDSRRSIRLLNAGSGGQPMHVLNLARVRPLLPTDGECFRGVGDGEAAAAGTVWPQEPPQCWAAAPAPAGRELDGACL